MYDVIVIGAGPAGISAALYVKRSNKDVLVLYSGESQLEKAHKIDNYYGFPNGISGKELYNNGIEQAKNLGVDVKCEEALNVAMNASLNYEVTTTSGKYESKALILSTGNKKIKPKIDGIEEFDGKGISYCAICDGFFYRNKNVAVIGNGDYALSEAADLENIVGNITILTDSLPAPEDCKYDVISKKIKRIYGDATVKGVEFEDGEKLEISGLFVALGSAGGADFAKKLGIVLDGDSIKTNSDMSTNIPGAFSCGNINGGLLQVCKAVYEGAQAGLSAISYIKNK